MIGNAGRREVHTERGDLAVATAGQKTTHASQGVAQGQRGSEQVSHVAQGPGAPARVEQDHAARCEGASVEDQAALPDIERRRTVGERAQGRAGRAGSRAQARIVADVQDHIEDARADDAGQQSPESQVENRSSVEAHPPSLVKRQQHARDSAQGDQQAVGMDVEAVGPEVQREEIRPHSLSRAGAGSASQRERRPPSSR